MRQRSATLFMILVCAFSAFSQILLHSFYSRSVSEGYSVQTKVDSLLVETEVSNGLAVTRMTFVLTPGYYGEVSYIKVSVDTISGGVETTVINEGSDVEEPTPVVLDSIEIRTSFQLPTDFVADSMWLWVEGEKVPAYIQDRSLAAAQYNQIVGVRRDPALLETWGNGSYNLRIFPTSSMVSRKVMLQFHHTFDDDSASLTTACVPIAYDSLNARYYYGYQSFDKSIGYINTAFSTTDNESYNVDFPGIGEGTFAKDAPLSLEVENAYYITSATMCTDDISGDDEFLWIGTDAVDGTRDAGFSLELSDAWMRFEDEPDTKVIAIDMRNTIWDWNEYYTLRATSYDPTSAAYYTIYEEYNVWERAQKYAILALRQYVADGEKFNVILGGEQVHMVFDAPVDATAENLNAAIDAIVAATASAESNTQAVLTTAIEQAGEGIVILISDFFQPYDYYTYKETNVEVSSAGEAYNESIENISGMVTEADVTLFTICDNSQLNSIALATGGYRLSGVLNRYNIQYEYKVIDGRRIAIPELPPLYGSDNYSGIRDLEVASDILSDIVFSNDGYYNRYYSLAVNGGGIARDDVAMGSAEGGFAKVRLPNYSSATLFLRIAGRLPKDYSGSEIQVVISGKMGGLRFAQNVVTVPFSTVTAGNMIRNPQWGFRKCEQLSYDDYIGKAEEIKTIGTEYHMVTRQTSLLALEPGMELWEDSTWQQNDQNVLSDDGAPGAGGGFAAGAESSRDYTSAGSAPTSEIGEGVAFDGISLDDLLYERDISAVLHKNSKAAGFAAKVNGTVVSVVVPKMTNNQKITLRLFDLTGRMVAEKTVSAVKTAGNTIHWNIADEAGVTGTGMYMMRITAGSITKSLKMTLLRR